MTSPYEITLPERPIKKASLVGEELEGMNEFVYLDNEDGSGFTLNATASAILELCDGTRTLNDIANIICETVQSDPQTVQNDVRAILTEFTAFGLFQE